MTLETSMIRMEIVHIFELPKVPGIWS
ncbi:hypothetical protein CCACVL1_00078, partial [Corchorus capsularis]